MYEFFHPTLYLFIEPIFILTLMNTRAEITLAVRLSFSHWVEQYFGTDLTHL